jgi:hypothetical protein
LKCLIQWHSRETGGDHPRNTAPQGGLISFRNVRSGHRGFGLVQEFTELPWINRKI